MSSSNSVSPPGSTVRKPLNILDIPPEIRYLIWAHVLGLRTIHIKVHPDLPKAAPYAVQLDFQQPSDVKTAPTETLIHDEGTNVLYESNTFSILGRGGLDRTPVVLKKFLTCLKTEEQGKSIRNLHLRILCKSPFSKSGTDPPANGNPGPGTIATILTRRRNLSEMNPPVQDIHSITCHRDWINLFDSALLKEKLGGVRTFSMEILHFKAYDTDTWTSVDSTTDVDLQSGDSSFNALQRKKTGLEDVVQGLKENLPGVRKVRVSFADISAARKSEIFEAAAARGRIARDDRDEAALDDGTGIDTITTRVFNILIGANIDGSIQGEA
ncbi:hypothetical protein MMC25_005300 [Agyrium rufum]|nr:hypothetical protein [Agyrium rufum]